MNYSEYCKLKLNQYNFARTSSAMSLSTPFGTFTSSTSTGTFDAGKEASKAVSKAMKNLRTAVENDVAQKETVDRTNATPIDESKLYVVTEGKEGTKIKPKLESTTGYNNDRRDLANADAKRKNEGRSEFSNVKSVVKSGNQVAKMMPDKYITKKELNKEFHSNTVV